MILTTFWRRGGTWQRLNCSSRLHSRALKMGSELESRCSRSFQDSSSTHRHSAAQQRSLSIRTHWLLCSPPPGFLGFIFFLLFFCRFLCTFPRFSVQPSLRRDQGWFDDGGSLVGAGGSFFSVHLRFGPPQSPSQ